MISLITKGDKIQLENCIAEVIGMLGLEEVLVKLPKTKDCIWVEREKIEKVGD